jgi:homogentisate 1,2-dioxygenase
VHVPLLASSPNNMASASGATAVGPFITEATPNDPYQYQVGFGNRFASEAL